MGAPQPLRPDPVPISSQAIDNLRYIREAMAASSQFTAVPGWGGVVIGASALLAALATSYVDTPLAWLSIWLGEAAFALGVGGFTMLRKSRQEGQNIARGVGRRFVLNLSPALAAAALLTFVFVARNELSVLPGIWLLLYGVGVISAGAFSVRPVPIMGSCFMVLGGLALVVPAFGDLFMAMGFGGLHLGFGLWIARHHGG